MQFPISIGLYRSRIADRLLAVVAGLATAGVLWSPWPLAWRLLPLPLIGGLLWHGWKRLSPRVSRLCLLLHGELELQCEAGPIQVHLVGQPHVHPWLTVFCVRDDAGRKYWLVLTVDSLSTVDFRRLRVFLRGQAGFSAERDGAV